MRKEAITTELAMATYLGAIALTLCHEAVRVAYPFAVLSFWSVFEHASFVIANSTLTLLSRGATNLAVKFVSTAGTTGYKLRARSSIKGSFAASCNETTSSCELSDLPPGTDFTLWLVTCEWRRFKLCYLRAEELATYTIVQGWALSLGLYMCYMRFLLKAF